VKRALLLVGLLLSTRAAAKGGSGIEASRHNLSVTGPGSIKSQSETRLCVFCHVTHGGRKSSGNRPASMAVYRQYRSSSMAATAPLTVSGSSRLCLSCHDGTIAVGQTLKRFIPLANTGPGGRMPAGRANLGTDLSGSHPVSFRPGGSRSTHAPPPGDDVKLDKHGLMQCTSCHDPHSEDVDPEQQKFLVKPNRASAICQSCHTLPQWQGASHQGFGATPRGALARPGSASPALDGGCAACHASHGGSPRSLVKVRDPNAGDDRACLECHDGRGASTNVGREVAKTYAHAAPEFGPSGHEPGEAPNNAQASLPERRPGAARHVACVDCHDPHAATVREATAPRAKGSLAGVWGIDRNGQRVEPASFEYEVCFKCHADSANQPQARGPRPPSTVRRAVVDANLRRVFDASAASSHPVEGPGRNADVPSLIPPLTVTSVVYCSDCHGSDAAGAAGQDVPRGPHGSVYPQLLKRNYSTMDPSPESPSAYALCYGCHSREVLLSDQSSFRLHRKHVVDGSTPCSTCHNAHGVSAVAGTPINNAHLIDFDTTVVRPGPRGLRLYTTRGYRGGTCALTCHGVPHDNAAY
jgi:predicted CXXCH cytochrome family protein